MKLLAALLLGTFSATAADTFVVHGLSNVTIGQAVYNAPRFNNLRTNGSDGVSIILGEADSGVFVSGYVTDDPRAGSFVAGKLYGSINGETNRLICSMRCHEESDGHHPVEIDFSPLSASLLTYQAFYQGALVAQSPPRPGHMVAYGNWFEPLHPRVNPFWRMPDGSVGALIEFAPLDFFTGPSVFVPGVGDVRADRLFIRLDSVSNVVDFTSRLDITGGGGIAWFSVDDTRLGIFRHAHKALTNTLLNAHGGRLTLAGQTPGEIGAAIELEQASRFEVTFVPIELNPGAALVVSGIGLGGDGPGESLGSARIAGTAAGLELSTDFLPETVIYRQGVEVARRAGTNAAIRESIRILGCDLQSRVVGTPAGIHIRLERVVPITFADETSHDGDEVRFVRSEAAVFTALETMVLTASGLESFTIVAETEHPLTRPRLNIVRVHNDNAVTLSWVDPTRIFRLEDTRSLATPFYDSGIWTTYDDDDATDVSFEVDGVTEPIFYRLSTAPRPRPGDDD